MYTSAIIQMLTWPLLIFISYYAIGFVLKKYGHLLNSPDEKLNE